MVVCRVHMVGYKEVAITYGGVKGGGNNICAGRRHKGRAYSRYLPSTSVICI